MAVPIQSLFFVLPLISSPSTLANSPIFIPAATKRLNSSCSDLTIVSLGADAPEDACSPTSEKTVAHLVNKQRVLPFVPPSFPGGGSASNNLIKPSEYLRSISDKRAVSVCSTRSPADYEDAVTVKTEEAKNEEEPPVGPPPPPMPELLVESPAARNPSQKDTGDGGNKKQQPLSAISIQDLNSVQLRRTDKMIASKTFSAPTRSVSLQCLQSEPYLAQKIDLIAELKLSKDITGIRKMKIEKAKVEQKQEKELYSEISKQFTVINFVEKVRIRRFWNFPSNYKCKTITTPHQFRKSEFVIILTYKNTQLHITLAKFTKHHQQLTSGI